jgi:hypothetical protein
MILLYNLPLKTDILIKAKNREQIKVKRVHLHYLQHYHQNPVISRRRKVQAQVREENLGTYQ